MLVGHALADEIEEFAGQIGRAPFAVGGREVEAVERVPMPRLDRAAGQRLDLDAARERIAPLAADLLALARIERREEVVEAAHSRHCPNGIAGPCAAGTRPRRSAPIRACVGKVTWSDETLCRRASSTIAGDQAVGDVAGGCVGARAAGAARSPG